MAAPLLGLTFVGTFVGDPVTLFVLVGVFLAEFPSDDVLVVEEGEGLAAASGWAPPSRQGAVDLHGPDPYLVS